jgi:molybdopterin-containing oxidoreductase family membrane subunit
MKRASVALLATVALLLVGVAVGGFAYCRQILAGEVVTSMRTLGAGGAVWGLYIVMDGFCLGAGVAIMACACIVRFSRDRDMEAAARIAMPIALLCFLAAALSVLADQGRPYVALANLTYFARPESPFFATFTTVGAVCLFGSLVHYVLARRPDLAVYAQRPSFWQPLQRCLAAGYRGTPGQRRRRQQVGFWMSLLMLPALAFPLAALAIIFTVRPGRPWPLAMCEAVAFTFASGVAGLGLLVLAAALVGWLSGPVAGLGPRGFARLGRGLLLVDALAVLSVVAAAIGGFASGEPAAAALARALIGEPYGGLFWSELGLFFLAGFMLWRSLLRKSLRPGVVVGASVLSLLAVFLQRYLLLVAWQTHGLPLPYRAGSYSPSWIEVAVVAGIVALGLLLFLPAVRLIPFAPAAHEERRVAGAPADARRALITSAWFALGVVVTAAGLLLCLRVGTEPYLDPVVAGSPVVFLAGLMILATTGAVYEVLPEPRDGAR